MPLPGIEPGSPRPQRGVLTTILEEHDIRNNRNFASYTKRENIFESSV